MGACACPGRGAGRAAPRGVCARVVWSSQAACSRRQGGVPWARQAWCGAYMKRGSAQRALPGTCTVQAGGTLMRWPSGPSAAGTPAQAAAVLVLLHARRLLPLQHVQLLCLLLILCQLSGPVQAGPACGAGESAAPHVGRGAAHMQARQAASRAAYCSVRSLASWNHSSARCALPAFHSSGMPGSTGSSARGGSGGVAGGGVAGKDGIVACRPCLVQRTDVQEESK